MVGKTVKVEKRKEGIKHIELTVNILRQIWKRRNYKTFNKEHKYGRDLINAALQERSEFGEANREATRVSTCETGEKEQMAEEEMQKSGSPTMYNTAGLGER